MRKQDYAQLMCVCGLGVGVVSFRAGRHRRAAVFLGIATAADLLARRASRERPGPLPASLRWVLAVPRPSGGLRRALAAEPGERILEIGPGLGQQATVVARWVGPEGQVDVVDVQPEMLQATAARAIRRGVGNVVPQLVGPSDVLPYEDEAFDRAYLSSVLGEISDPANALRELHRVLKKGGRLVVSELAIDPDFISPRRLEQLCCAAGFERDARFGWSFAYYARYKKP